MKIIYIIMALLTTPLLNAEESSFLLKTGRVLECINNGQISYEMLDNREARDIHHVEILIPKVSPDNEFEAARIIIERIQKLHPLRHDLLWGYIGIIEDKDNRRDVGNFTLSGRNADTLLEYNNCTQKTVARMFKDGVHNHVKYLFNYELYNKLDFTNKVSLIIHLALSFDATYISGENALKDPIGLRMYNIALLSHQTKEWSTAMFTNFLKIIGFYGLLDL